MDKTMYKLASGLRAAAAATLFACCALPVSFAPLPACAAEVAPADLAILRQAALGDAAQLKALLARGGNPNAVDDKGATALWVALGSGRADAVEALLDAGATGLNTPVRVQPGSYALSGLDNPVRLGRETSFTLLSAAATRGQADMVRMLLKRGADPLWLDSRQQDILFALAGWKDADLPTMQALLDSGKIRLDRRFTGGQTYLMTAALTGSPAAVQLLLDHGAHPDGRDDGATTPLMLAVVEGREDIVRILLDHGATPGLFYANGTSALTNVGAIKDTAVRERVRQMLLAKGAPKEDKNRPVDTLFLNAVRKGDIAAAEQALRQGADLEVRGAGIMGYGSSALGEAVDHPAMVQFLLDKGANVHAWCCVKTTALHTAAFHGSPETVRLLVEHGIDVNVRNKYGAPPFLFAVTSSNKNRAAVVAAFLELGADPNGKVSNSDTYLAYARRKGLADIEALLVAAGAK